MISTDEVVDLLSLAATFDQRTVGEMDVKGWFLVASQQRWSAAAAQRVIVEYYAQDADRRRIAPAAISDGIRAVRRTAAWSFVPPRTPVELPDGEYPAWYRARLAEFVDGAVASWADGGPMPTTPAEVETGPARLPLQLAPPAVRDEVSRHLERIGSLPPAQSGPRRVSPLDLDPRRRADARAELDAVRAGNAGSAPVADRPERGTA